MRLHSVLRNHLRGVNYLFAIGLIIMAYSAKVIAQPTASILLPEKVCKTETFNTVNTSTDATQFLWEFCYGGLQTSPSVTSLGVTSAASAPDGMTLNMDAGNYVGFVVSTNANNLIRLDFGGSLSNNPIRTNMGTFDGLLERPRSISIIQYESNWYGLVTNFNPGNGTASVVRFSFGDALSNIPTVTSLGTFSGRLVQPQAVHWVTDHGDLIALIGDRSQRKILMVNFDQDPSTTSFSVSAFKEITFSGSGFFRDFSIVRGSDRWYGLAIFENGGIHKINFAPALFDIPQVTQITPNLPDFTLPYNVSFLRDVDRFVAIVSQYGGFVIRLDFGKNPASIVPSYQNFGNLGTLNNLQGLAFYKTNTGWIGFTHNSANSWLYRILFDGICDATLALSTQQQPSLAYTIAGVKYASLQSVDVKGETRFVVDSILVKMDPQSAFSFNLNCTGQSTLFRDESIAQGELSWQWDFNDPLGAESTSTSQHPHHQFTAATDYNVVLTVTDDCGNTDQVIRTVSVSDDTAIEIGIVSDEFVCSHQEKVYSLMSNTLPVTQVTWDFGDGGSSYSEEATFIYNDSGMYTITVDAVVNECMKQATKPVEVKRGSQVLFSYSPPCEKQPTLFTHQIVDNDIVSYQWSFPSGETIAEENPEFNFEMAGDFDVTLSVENSIGCNTLLTKSVAIYSKPQTNFSVALPPFSCNGTPTQFTDLTPNPFDSNITAWLWNFGEGGTSTLRNPQHTFVNAGDYNVSLTATTNFGCSTLLELPVTISQSPTANFTNTPSCLGVPVSFTNTSTGSLQSQQWQIESTFYTLANPVHAFTSAGNKNVTLNITATNGCVASVGRILGVPNTIAPDFTFTRNCINQQTEFISSTVSPTDPITAYAWNFAGLGTGNLNPQVFAFSNTGNFNVSLSVTTQTGCVYSVAKNVNIINAPQANFTASPSVGAPPLQVQFTNTSVNATSYSWAFNDPTNSTSTVVSPSFTYGTLGQYVADLTAYNAQGCSDLFSSIVQVVIPFTDIALTELELSPVQNNSVKPTLTIHNKSNIAVFNLPLRFELGDAIIRDFVPVSIEPNTTYRHVVDFEIPRISTVNYVCVNAEIEDNSPDDNRICASVDETFNFLEPYPNPVSSQNDINVEWVAPDNRSAEILLVNSLGQQVIRIEATNSSVGFNTTVIPATDLQSGMYYVQIRYGSIIRTHRIQVVD